MRAAAVVILAVGLGLVALAPASAAAGPGRPGPFRTEIAATYVEQGHRITLAGSGVVSSAGSLDAHLVFSGLPKSAGLGTHVAFDERVIGTSLYMHSPLLMGKLPAGKTWVTVDLRQTGSAAGVELDLLQGIDPAQGLPALLASGSATKTGAETVGGAPTTRYRVDVSRVVAGAAAKARIRLVQITGQKTEPVDVWVDGDGVVRKVAAVRTGGKRPFSVSAVYRDAGSTAKVTAPPAATTFDPAAADRLARQRAKANATNPWARAASRACRSNNARARKEIPNGPGTTPKSQLAFTRKALPIEVELLQKLRALRTKPPVGAKHAIDLLAADVAEARGVIAAAGNTKLFTTRFARWLDDHRANDAFAAAGLPACAG